MIARTYIVADFVAVVLGAGGCKSAKTPAEAPSASAKAPKTPDRAATGAEPPARPDPQPDPRAGRYAVHSLLDELARFELSVDGPFVSLGTPDRHKYTRGGWRSGWLDSGADGDTAFARATTNAKLFVHAAEGGARAVSVRLRSTVARQSLRLYVGTDAVATEPVTKAFSVLTFTLKEPLPPGRHTLTLSFPRGRKGKPAADVAWVWLHRATSVPEKMPDLAKAAVRSFGDPRRSLVADAPRRLQHYLVVPKDAELVFDYGAEGKTTFEVRLAADGEESERVLTTVEAKPGAWKTARVDLSAWAGKPVRLAFVTRGAGGRAAWGEPEIMRAGKAPEVPLVKGKEARNLIYIVIDTVRQDAFSAFNPKSEVHTPGMSKLAADALIFTNAYTNAPWTKPSIATALSSLYPSTHGAQGKGSVLDSRVRLLPEHLREQGFETGAFIANGFVSGKFGFKRGWDHYVNYIREGKPSFARHVYGEALAWLKKRAADKRFFLYIQAIDPHVPYQAPPEDLARYYPGKYRGPLGPSVSGYETTRWMKGELKLSKDDRAYIRGQYRGEITYHDEHFGKFLAAVAELGKLDESLLVVTNDHGEEMFDHGKIGHGHSLYEELVRNPFVLRYPPLLPRGKAVAAPAALVDLAPTALEVLGAEPLPRAEGLSLLPRIFGAPAAEATAYAVAQFRDHRRAVRLGDYKLIASEAGAKLFDLAKDPGEKKDLAKSHGVARRACEVHLSEALAIPTKHRRLTGVDALARFEAKQADVDPELRRQLEALGYINL